MQRYHRDMIITRASQAAHKKPGKVAGAMRLVQTQNTGYSLSFVLRF